MSYLSSAFIFLFLPVVLILFYLLPRGNCRRAVLVLSSLVFFAWVDLAHLPLLVVFVLINYGVGLWIGRLQIEERAKIGKAALWVGLGLNLLFLLLYKYLGSIAALLTQISQGGIEFNTLAIFFGISYLTFSGMSYLIDVHRETKPPERNILSFSAYLLMFPKLIQGPILLYKLSGRRRRNKIQPGGFRRGSPAFYHWAGQEGPAGGRLDRGSEPGLFKLT